MKKNYTKPEIQVSRYEVEDVTMSVASSLLFSKDGSVGQQVDAIKIVSYTDIFKG